MEDEEPFADPRYPRLEEFPAPLLESAPEEVKAAKRSGVHHPLTNRGPRAWEEAAREQQAGEWRPEVPRVLLHAVSDKPSLYSYFPSMKKFIRFCRKEGQPFQLEEPKTVDLALTWYCEYLCFVLKKDVQEGKDARSCLTHLVPDLKGFLPLTQRALKTWSTLQGKMEREPMCWAGAALVLEDLGKRFPMMGYAMWSQLDSLLREEDLEKLRWEDVKVSASSRVALELGQLHRGETTKGGPKKGVEVLDRGLASWFREEKPKHSGNDLVFNFPIAKYQKEFGRSVVTAYGEENAAEMEATPHVNRHSAAVHLLRDLGWSLGKLQGRGRWAEERSVRWYSHPHLQVKNESRLGAAQLKEGSALWDRGFSFDRRQPILAPTGVSVELVATEEAQASAYPDLAPLS
jgi:hypothetical protein